LVEIVRVLSVFSFRLESNHFPSLSKHGWPDAHCSDGGGFEWHVVWLITNGYEVGKSLDDREKTLREWCAGNLPRWHVDTSPEHIQRVNAAVAALPPMPNPLQGRRQSELPN